MTIFLDFLDVLDKVMHKPPTGIYPPADLRRREIDKICSIASVQHNTYITYLP